ncbi:hypothetical protein C7T94_07830 [Pedobacter yulinensis]|uniref:Aspartyl protease n=1 Tax=Pedobacter yulinensis TaxID=2126353 RepID=A0A2T3HJG6_9SPHI|nr:aspartyl protease family protein [Pedobacter yulinensis]PST82569.1 hypothetical protein C7T94_07830 [Pedobacter yulinensis]
MKKFFTCLLIAYALGSSAQTVPFRLTTDGHILVSAKIEGKDGTFIFDTGAGINLFFEDFASHMRQKSTYNFLTAFRATGERIDAPMFRTDAVVFAQTTFKNVPYSTFNMKVEGINGLISLQMFRERDVIIDYERKELTLTAIDPAKSRKSVDIQVSTFADDGLDIFTYVMLDNTHRIKVLLDSGAGQNSFWLHSKFMDLLGVDKNSFQVSEKKSEFNEKKLSRNYKGKIRAISNQFSRVDAPTVNFVDGLIYEGKTSINWLGSKIGISLKNKKLYVLD